MPALQEGAATALVISPYGAIAREFGRRLAAKGYGVRLATDPMQALLLLEDEPPSVILMARSLLPTGGLMFLRVLRSHTDVKTVPAVGFGTTQGVPESLLAEAVELGLLDELPTEGQTWSIDRRGSARRRAPRPTLTDRETIPRIGPIAIVQTKHGSVPLSIQAASPHRLDVICGSEMLNRGDTLRLVVREQITLDDDSREVNLRILAEVSGVQGRAGGDTCSLEISAAAPAEDYDAFVRWMGRR